MHFLKKENPILKNIPNTVNLASIKHWIIASRLRTLPLSVSGVLAGTGIAISEGHFQANIFFMALITTLFLQVLSNFANDFGDSRNGKDTIARKGPVRMVQSGAISLNSMKRMVVVFSFLSFISGLMLIGFSKIGWFSETFWILLTIGILSIGAALTYTIGKNPYGYFGWGDLSVLLFFGFFSVIGTYCLFSGKFDFKTLLPATGIGLFSVGVLNINNMRDLDDDRSTGKKTIVVQLGLKNAKIYHVLLIILGWFSFILNSVLFKEKYLMIFVLIVLPVFAFHIRKILICNTSVQFDSELKPLALFTFLISVIFAISLNI